VIKSHAVQSDSGSFLFDSPALYLKRLEDYNTIFPELSMEVIGVSKSDGKTRIWTAQPFIEGKPFDTYPELAAAMKKAGWKQAGHAAKWKHTDTGALITDVHRGNVLVDRNGNIHPIDVIPLDVGDLATPIPFPKSRLGELTEGMK
jgi:hypothetical protein